MLSRRAVAALALVPVLPAAAAVPDPVFAAIEAHRAACARIAAFCAADHVDDIPADLTHAESDRLAALVAMTPTTLAGCVAMLRYVEMEAVREDPLNSLFSNWCDEVSDPAATLLGRIAAVLDRA